MVLEGSCVMLCVDFGCGSGADEEAALKSWFGCENNSLLWSNQEWLQDVVEVAAAGTSTCGYLVQEDTNDDFIFWLIFVVKVEKQCFDIIPLGDSHSILLCSYSFMVSAGDISSKFCKGCIT